MATRELLNFQNGHVLHLQFWKTRHIAGVDPENPSLGKIPRGLQIRKTPSEEHLEGSLEIT